MLILGIESSCDETAAAIIKGENKSQKVQLLSNSLASSLFLHSKTGGIIPESAAREQVKYIIPVIKEALSKAKVNPKELDAIAVTYGPGLIGSLLVGVETAKALSIAWNKPLIPTNHLIGHIYANFIENSNDEDKEIEFPAIGLVVSGGHTDLVLINNHAEIRWLGGTRDDAAGECFDKCARLLGYAYPGGPKIAELAEKGNMKAISLPRPMIGSKDYEFSFSGLKAAFLRETEQHFPILRTSHSQISWDEIVLEKELKEKDKQTLYDLCASLQNSITEVIVRKTIKAAKEYSAKSILVGGGVAANQALQEKLRESIVGSQESLKLFIPPRNLCTDNGAMIATAAFYNDKNISWEEVNANPGLYFD